MKNPIIKHYPNEEFIPYRIDGWSGTDINNEKADKIIETMKCKRCNKIKKKFNEQYQNVCDNCWSEIHKSMYNY